MKKFLKPIRSYIFVAMLALTLIVGPASIQQVQAGEGVFDGTCYLRTSTEPASFPPPDALTIKGVSLARCFQYICPRALVSGYQGHKIYSCLWDND